MTLRRLGTHLLYATLMALWIYLGYLASGYRPDAAFTFWITAVGGGGLTLVRWVRVARGTAPLYRASDLDEDTDVKRQREVSVNPESEPDGGSGAISPGTSAQERTKVETRPERPTLALTDESWRIVRVVGSFVVILVGMRIVGLHVILPLYVAGYLYIWGEVRSVIALLSAALAIFLSLVLVFDYLLITPWPVSWLEGVLEQRWGRLFSGYLP